MSNLDVFTNVFERIDTSVQNVISNHIAGVMGIFSPVLISAFTVYVIFTVWSYFDNPLEQVVWDLIKRILAWGVIISFSINISSYSSNVLPIVMHLGDNMAQAFSGSSTTSSSLDSLVQMLTNMMNKNLDAADQVSGIEGITAKLYTYFVNFLVLIIFGLFLIIVGAYIVLAKVFLAILAVIGPVFIALALFPATRQYFSSWVNQVVNFSLYIVLVNVVGALLIDYLNSTFDETALLSDSGVVHLVLVLMLFCIIILKLPELASGLAGGISNNGFGALAQTASKIKGAVASKGSGGANSSTKSSVNQMRPESSGKK